MNKANAVKFRCIYCSNEDKPSREDYLPRCLGTFQGYQRLLNKVCTRCNNSFSDIEREFCRRSPEAFFREWIGIEGRKHHTRFLPFRTSRSHPAPLIMKGRFPGEQFEVLWEVNRGKCSIRELTQLVLKDSNGTYHQIPITEDMKHPNDLAAAIKNRGLENYECVRCTADTAEMGRVEQLVSSLLPDARVKWINPGVEGTRVQVTLESIISSSYYRAISKIGFHYFLKHYPRFSGAEEEFQPIRDFIRFGGKVESFVNPDPRQIIANLQRGARLKDYGHFLAAEVDHRNIRARLQFFLGADNVPIAWIVRIGKNPSRISTPPEQIGHLFSYHPHKDNTNKRFDGEIEQATTIRRITFPFPP